MVYIRALVSTSPVFVFIQAESIHALGEEIGTKLAKAEAVGAEGKVDESMTLMNEVEELKKKKTLAEVTRS